MANMDTQTINSVLAAGLAASRGTLLRFGFVGPIFYTDYTGVWYVNIIK